MRRQRLLHSVQKNPVVWLTAVCIAWYGSLSPRARGSHSGEDACGSPDPVCLGEGSSALQEIQNPSGVDPLAAGILAKYRVAAGGDKRLRDLRTVIAEGNGRRVPAFGQEAPAFYFRFRNSVSYQEVQLVPANFSEPEIRTLTEQGHWSRGVTIVADRAGTADRSLMVTRRHLLDLWLGIAPSLASDSGLVRLAYRGVEPINGRDCAALDVADASGLYAVLYFWNDTGLPAKLTVRRAVTIPTPREQLVDVWYEDYRSIQAVRVPFTIRRYGGETITINRYFLNVPVPEQLFSSPRTESDLQFILNYHPSR